MGLTRSTVILPSIRILALSTQHYCQTISKLYYRIAYMLYAEEKRVDIWYGDDVGSLPRIFWLWWWRLITNYSGIRTVVPEKIDITDSVFKWKRYDRILALINVLGSLSRKCRELTYRRPQIGFLLWSN